MLPQKRFSSRLCRQELPAVFCTALCAVICLVQPMYSDIDNYWVSMSVTGLYGQSHLCPYLHPLLCDALYGLGRLLPQSDPFVLTARWMLTLALFLLCREIAHACSLPLAWILSGLMCTFVSSTNLWSNNYTVQAAFFAMAGMVLLCAQLLKERVSPLRIAAGTWFVCLGSMWRYKGALLVLPFLLLHLAAAFCAAPDRARLAKRALRIFLPSALCILLLLVSWHVVRDNPPYAEGIKYSNARSALVDYPRLPWEAVADQLPEYTAEDYSFLLLDTDHTTAEMLDRFAQVSGTTAYPLTPGGFVQASIQSVRGLLASRKLVFFAAILAALTLRLLIALRRSVLLCAEVCLAWLGSWFILLVFVWKGRAPVRVYESVLYALLGVLLLLAFQTRPARRATALLGGMVALGFVAGVLLNEFCVPKTALTARTGADDSAWAQVCADGDDLYIFQTFYYDHWAFDILWRQGKLPSDAFRRHTFPDDAWSYGQLYFEQYLQELGAANPLRSLLERPHTYYYGDSPDGLLDYLQKNYAPDARATQVDEMNGVPIWQFSTAG